MDSAVNKLSAKSALVVDDGPVERMAGKSMLEKLGFSVITAASGEEALRLLEDQPADLVLCDISMPGIGGMGLLEATRGRPQPPLFIMSTSHDDAEHAVASLRNGAYGYLTKPLRFDTLRATVVDAIAKYEEQKSASVNEMALAHHDTLTGLMNKAGFSQRLTDRLRDMPDGTSAGALLLLKIVGLNHINHSYGRNEGNKALQLSARILSRLVRSSDLLARFGGDMFAIHFDAIDHGQVEQRILNVAETVESTKMPLAGEVLTLTVVAGGACAYGMMEMEDLLNRADFALHLARDRSRNRIHLYSEADDVHKRELSHQLNTVAVVRAALRDTQRIAMHYQPIINLDTGAVSHYEALLRLMDDNGTPCNTGELVKTCEVFGLIGELDRAVVKATLRDVARVPANAGIAINLSGKSIGDPDLLHLIETRIKSLEIDPSRIIFELTETAAFYNLEEVRHFVRRIKSLGCRFALDDFGVGFSSFYYIKELDFDYLKLDGSFIAKLPHSPNDQVFVRAMVEISRVFGMDVIAEWVEDQETADILRGFGVALGQGYHFGKPALLK
ncbi:putative bifunctional diguanylate cyclase/phosphodiesterase [Noviherbaspirillum sp.]|uniref:putative bifunctional diguanylate cyclase/phosphodiesterase n=1 Tax=Noviherbaspirillum sp. TaxID=1926288 RepID=UPI002B475709|nr:EAL domain-containing protein [Noviherbaspirillum sp.]HJV80031.1 EAL domain-containing protein [Noviherbaspirillum sp.]